MQLLHSQVRSCQYCTFRKIVNAWCRFRTMQGLLRHMKTCTKAPTKDVTFACRHCAKIFSSRRAMEKHEKQHTASSVTSNPPVPHTWQINFQRKGAVPAMRCFGAIPRLCCPRACTRQTWQQVSAIMSFGNVCRAYNGQVFFVWIQCPEPGCVD